MTVKFITDIMNVEKKVFRILAETHTLIADKLFNRVYSEYGIRLNKKKLRWGSVAPDYLPYYKFKRHYLEESIGYISSEIVNLIYISRYVDFYNMKPFFKKFFSKRLGIISHYLCDFTTKPHAIRETCTNIEDLKSHIKYEKDLAKYSLKHEFKVLDIDNSLLYSNHFITMRQSVEQFVRFVIDRYLENESSFENDLDYAMSLSFSICDFIFETIFIYSEEMELQFI